LLRFEISRVSALRPLTLILIGDWRSEEKTDALHQEITVMMMLLALITPFFPERCLYLLREFFSLDWCLLMGDPSIFVSFSPF